MFLAKIFFLNQMRYDLKKDTIGRGVALTKHHCLYGNNVKIEVLSSRGSTVYMVTRPEA